MACTYFVLGGIIRELLHVDTPADDDSALLYATADTSNAQFTADAVDAHDPFDDRARPCRAGPCRAARVSVATERCQLIRKSSVCRCSLPHSACVFEQLVPEQ